MLYLFLGYKLEFSKLGAFYESDVHKSNLMKSDFQILHFLGLRWTYTSFFLRYLVKFNGVLLFSWVTMLLVACTQMLCYFSFRPFRIHQRVLALAVNKSPVVFIFYRTLNKLWRENRGSVNRLCCWSPAS